MPIPLITINITGYPEQMAYRFDQLHPADKAKHAKKEFQSIVRAIFENPEVLKALIKQKLLTIAQSKAIIKSVNKLNSKECGCCRIFDYNKIQLPISKELEPIIDIAQFNLKTRTF